jgi:hypothetical protein
MSSQSQKSAPIKLNKPVDLARQAQYEKIKFQNLTHEEVTEFDQRGFTFLHYAAYHGMWEKLPKRLQDPKYWQESKDGDTIYMSAFAGSRAEWIIKKNLSEKDILKRNKNGDFIAWMTTKNKTLYMLPKKSITLNVLTQEVPNEIELLPTSGNGTNLLIHEIAEHQLISVVPKKLITTELLSLRGLGRKSVFHLIADNSQALAIPKELWDRKTLTLQCREKITPLHSIAHSFPSLIPKDISLEDIIRKSKKGSTALHAWTRGFGWVNIPNRFITHESLHMTDEDRNTPLEIMISQYNQASSTKVAELEKLTQNKIVYALGRLEEEELKTLKSRIEEPISRLASKELGKHKIIKSLRNEDQNQIEI